MSATLPATNRSLFQNFDHEVADGFRYVPEPVRRARRDDNHVSLRQMVGFSALYFGAQILSRGRELAADHLAARYEGGFTVLHVDDVGLFLVNFDLSGLSRWPPCTMRFGPVSIGPPFASDAATVSCPMYVAGAGASAAVSSAQAIRNAREAVDFTGRIVSRFEVAHARGWMGNNCKNGERKI